MSDDGVKLNQTDPLVEQPEGGSLGSEVAWLRSSVVLNGKLEMTVALAKLSFATVSAWAAVPSPTAATASPAVSVINKRARRPMPPPKRPHACRSRFEVFIGFPRSLCAAPPRRSHRLSGELAKKRGALPMWGGLPNGAAATARLRPVSHCAPMTSPCR